MEQKSPGRYAYLAIFVILLVAGAIARRASGGTAAPAAFNFVDYLPDVRNPVVRSTSTPTPMFTPKETLTPTETTTPTVTGTPTTTASPTITETPTTTGTSTATPTVTDTATVTDTPTRTATATSTPTVTQTPTITETPTVTATPTITLTLTVTLTSTPTADNRFGITITGSVSAATALPALGVSWWYSYGTLPSSGAPGTQVAEIQLGTNNSTPMPVATIQAAALEHPGAYWLIGNEPNVPGAALVSTDYYATSLQYYATAIKGADPTAQIVGPNVLNWSYTCTGCSGYTSGQAFVDGIRTSWANLYGGEPPIDVWSLHSYPISWDKLPMTDASIVEQQVSGFSTYLAAIPAHQNKPIWLTEFGVLWGYDAMSSTTTGCAQAPNCWAPVGSFDMVAVTAYLNTLLPWMTANSGQYRLNRWFLYTTIGAPLGFSTAYPGISLLDSTGAPTTLGQLYQQYALGQHP